MKFFLLPLYLLLFVYNSTAQTASGLMLEPTIHYGKLIKHTPKLNFIIDQPSYGFELDIKKQTLGEKEWHQLHRYPVVGLALTYYQLGNPDTLGFAFSATPHLNIYLLRRPKMDAHFRFGYGLAYLNRHFDFTNNPSNNAIGSPFNVNVQIDFAYYYHFSPHWSFKTGLSFRHYSNGAASLPNFGLNIAAGMLGLRYRPQAFTEADYHRIEGLSKKPLQRWGLDVNLGVGYRERGSFGGPKNPVYIMGLAGVFHSNRINSILLGSELEFNKGVYLFGKHVGEFATEREARLRSMRASVFIGDEVSYGNVSLSMQLGVYLHKVYLGVFPVYNRFVVRYYFPPVGRPEGRFYTGIQLKSHLVIAEYFSIIGGVRF